MMKRYDDVNNAEVNTTSYIDNTHQSINRVAINKVGQETPTDQQQFANAVIDFIENNIKQT